jgi:hypothetical protein
MASLARITPAVLTAQRPDTLEPRARMVARGSIVYALGYAAMLSFDAPGLLLHLMLLPPSLMAA